MTKKKIVSMIVLFGSIGISLVILFFFVTCVWIGYDVKRQCQEAKQLYGIDCVHGLMKTVTDGKRSFRERNEAIWALGQLGDVAAAPVLEQLYTGNIPEREPLDRVISQYELKKAIALVHGGMNIGAFLWRYGIQ